MHVLLIQNGVRRIYVGVEDYSWGSDIWRGVYSEAIDEFFGDVLGTLLGNIKCV